MADSKNKKNSVTKKVQTKAKSKVKSKAKRAGKSVMRQVWPVVFLLVAVFLLVCFVTNLFCNPHNELKGGDEGSHAMGPLGFYICEVFFGLFGHVAFLIPIILAFLAIFWNKYAESGKAFGKLILAIVTILLSSAFIHILIMLIADEASYNFGVLYRAGAALEGGGVLGGYLGYLFYLLLRGGSIFLLGIVVPVLACYLFGLPLHVYIGKLGDLIRYKWEHRNDAPKNKSKKNRPSRSKYDEDDEDGEDDEPEQIKVKPVPTRAKEKDEKKLSKSQNPSDDDEIRIKLPDAADEEETESDDENFRDDVPVSAFGKKATSKSDTFKSEDADEDEIENDEICINALDYDDFEDEITINGKAPRIDTKTGEVIFDEGADDSLEEERIVFDDDIKDELGVVEEEPVREYKFPPIDLLKKGGLKSGTSEAEIEENKQILREVLESFKIKVKDITCSCGPTITRYEIKPDAGVRVRAIANLVDDIALALAKSGVRIEAPIPGKAAVGVEVPNDSRANVLLRSIIETPEFQNHKSKIASCLGADVSGHPVVFDIEKMPHLLVAGTTGSGKSVCINTIIASILYRAKPDEVKLVLIDPKKVEFNVYRDIPHLSCKIVTDPKKAAGALNSAVNEMEKRFELIEEVGVRNITGYNEITKNDPDKPFMPRMVIIIDELADLMMTAPDEVETAICRIAQKARAAGIHLILGTQRPSVDVITGLIKANIPSRIAFTVTSSVDSRTIIDIGGAEKLIGMGDMLYSPVGSPKPQRVQGAFVSDGEVESIVDYIKSNNAPVRYNCEFEKSIDEEAAKCGNPAAGKSGGGEAKVSSGEEDPKLYEAVELAIEAGKISTSLLQRKLEVGYGRAAKIIDRMEELGYVGPADGNKPRKILVTVQDLAEKQINDNNDAGIFD
ncbi:MAG: DNA translocase FtsK [Ruminococcaceae bacterium]|nr:DNA translocase FtsK [Oscillospiraceae bacterium]